MPYKTLRGHLSFLRALMLFVATYAVIRLAIPWLADTGVPFWMRAIFLAMGPFVGMALAPLVIVHVRQKR